VLIRIFGPEREGVKGGYRKLHSEVFHNFYCSSHIIMVNKRNKDVTGSVCGT